jgi:hypothetical protein
MHQVDAQLTFVVQGDKVTETGISKHVTAKLQQTELQRPWKAQLVFSTAPSDQFPSSAARENVQNRCIIESSPRKCVQDASQSALMESGEAIRVGGIRCQTDTRLSRPQISPIEQ